MEERSEKRIFYRNSVPIVISDLTMHICSNCGQESMPLPSARIVEDVLNGKHKPSDKFTDDLYESQVH